MPTVRAENTTRALDVNLFSAFKLGENLSRTVASVEGKELWKRINVYRRGGPDIAVDLC